MVRLRHAAAATASVLVLVGVGAACTTFGTEEVEARDSGSATDGNSDAGADTADAVDADAAPGAARGCVGLALGNYCGRGLELYEGKAQDLVRCFGDGGMSTVTPCSAGCVVMPSGRRDICNPCVGAPAGTYCVNQVVADYNTNDVRIACSANMVTTTGAAVPKICPKGCGDAGNFGDCL